MISERSTHITKTNAVLAAASGTLLGAGILYPPLGGFGVVVGAVGVLREKGRQRDIQVANLKDYIESNSTQS